MLIIHAPNVHRGGGRVLLLPLLDALRENSGRAIIDSRLELPDTLLEVVAMSVAPTMCGRLAAEWKLRCMTGPGDVVVCFGNLPPLFKICASTVVFVQNFYLVCRRPLHEFKWRTKIRITVERLWLKFRLNKSTKLVVQTQSMAREVKASLGVTAYVLPFAPVRPDERQVAPERRFDFIYVASGEPHKNHKNLIRAWKLLAEEGLKPSLCLTLDNEKESSLLGWIDGITSGFRLNVHNFGQLSNERLTELLKISGALIYPSYFESFGLPLLEASTAGLPIVASELDYVRDVVEPITTFDPHSPVSISRAVKRFLKVGEQAPHPISPSSFLREIQGLV